MDTFEFKMTSEFQKFNNLQLSISCLDRDIVRVSPSNVFACVFLILGKYDYPENNENYISGNFSFTEGFKNKKELIEKLVCLMDKSVSFDYNKTNRGIIDGCLRLISIIFNSHSDMELLKTINSLLFPLNFELKHENKLVNSYN